MRSKEAYIDYYSQLKVWLYPTSPSKPDILFWKKIQNDTSYQELFRSFDWNSTTGIDLVVGKKGVRVIEVSTEVLLKKALRLLGLPENYPWIIKGRNYGIIVDTPSVSSSVKGMKNRKSKKVLLLWEGYYALPFTDIPRYFYKNRMPKEHPAQINDDVFINCVNNLID